MIIEAWFTQYIRQIIIQPLYWKVNAIKMSEPDHPRLPPLMTFDELYHAVRWPQHLGNFGTSIRDTHFDLVCCGYIIGAPTGWKTVVAFLLMPMGYLLGKALRRTANAWVGVITTRILTNYLEEIKPHCTPEQLAGIKSKLFTTRDELLRYLYANE